MLKTPFDPDCIRKHIEWQRRRKLPNEVTVPIGHESIDQFVGSLGDFRGQCIDTLLAKRSSEKLPLTLMLLSVCDI